MSESLIQTGIIYPALVARIHSCGIWTQHTERRAYKEDSVESVPSLPIVRPLYAVHERCVRKSHYTDSNEESVQFISWTPHGTKSFVS